MSNVSSRPQFPRFRLTHAIWILAASCFVLPIAVGDLLYDPSQLTPLIIGNLPGGLPHANEGAFVGGETGTPADASVNNVRQEDDLGGGGYDIPTGGPPSPLFGAQPFSQQMLRFEEFGPVKVPSPYPASGSPCPSAPDPQSCVPGLMADTFLAQPLYPKPTRLANDHLENPWKSDIEGFLQRPCYSAPLEGRPPGEGWAHQRWSEFPPQVYYQSIITGARDNGGLRDSLQTHCYGLDIEESCEFGPGGLYYNSTGLPGFEGTCAGIPIRFHPAMPKQEPSAIWTFDGTLPPKLLMVRYGESVMMRLHNGLPIDPSANRGFGLHTITVH